MYSSTVTYLVVYLCCFLINAYQTNGAIIKTHDSESRGQEEAAVRDE